MPVERPIVERPGLQAERTDLSWTRTSLAFLANGALLLLRSELHAPDNVHLVASMTAFLFALFAAVMARRRRRVLAVRPLPEVLAAPASLLLLAVGTALLGLVTFVMICLT